MSATAQVAHRTRPPSTAALLVMHNSGPRHRCTTLALTLSRQCHVHGGSKSTGAALALSQRVLSAFAAKAPFGPQTEWAGLGSGLYKVPVDRKVGL